jgi:hypothetical protein
MSNIIPFSSSNIPAHLRSSASANSDLTDGGGVSLGFPSISLKGKVFSVRREGTRTVLPNPKDPDSAATSIEAVIIKANKDYSKVYYAVGWKEGDDSKPTCFSDDNKTPDRSIEAPQSTSCVTCKHNQWGSKISDSGNKLKSCGDSRRIAVAAINELDDPMLLRVPAASLKALKEYGAKLTQMGVDYNKIATRIAFDVSSATPKLTFTAIGGLSEELAEQSVAMAESEIVDSIVHGGTSTSHDDESESRTQADKVIRKVSKREEPVLVNNDDIDNAVTKAMSDAQDVLGDAVSAAPAAPVAEKPKAKPKAKEIPSMEEINFDDIDFDD